MKHLPPSAGTGSRAYILLLSASLLSGHAHAQETTFTGPAVWPPNQWADWNVASHWSDGLPDANSDVILPTKINQFGNETNSDISLDTNATINSLTIHQYTNLRTFRQNLFVNGISSIEGQITVAEAQFSLGDLAQFDSESGDLLTGPNFVIDCLNPPMASILEFRGANIVSNHALIQLFGPDANISLRDQNTGLSALLNFANNHNFFSVNGGYFLDINGNITNHSNAILTANYGNTGTYPQVPAGYRIAGNLVNDGRIDLYSNSSFVVSGGVSGSGTIRVLGLPCNLQVLADVEFDLGEFDMGGSGIDGFILKAQNALFSNGATVKGSGTIEANVSVNGGVMAPGNSPGKIAVKGNLTITGGSELQMEIGGTAHDQILHSGDNASVTLGGTLSLTTIADFDDEVLSTSSYVIMESSQPLTGSFANVTSGERVNTADGKGSFRVDYGVGSTAPTKVVLSDYIAVNAPQTYAQWIATQGVPAGQESIGHDPNNDGLVNLEAYFRGVPAKGAAKRKPITTRVENGFLIATLYSARTVTGVMFGSRTASDLSTWAPGPAPVLVGTTPARNIYEVSIPVGSSPAFIGFQIDLQE